MRRALLISAFLWPLPALAAPPAADEPPPAEPAEAAPAADEPAPTEAPPASPADEVLALRQKRAKELRARAATMLASGRTDEGIDALRAALDAYPAYPLALNELGAAFAKKGKLAEAQASFEAALELDPSMTTARANLAEVLRRQNRHEDALAELGKVVEADPRDAGAWYSTAASLMTLKREPQALFAMERYLEVAPKGAGDKERVASVGERVKALRDDGVAPEAPWAAAVAETPETPPEPGEPSEPTVAVAPGELPFHVGDTAYYAKRYGDALKSYEADLAGHPDDVALLYKIGATKAVMNDYAGALRAWRQALVLEPDRPLLLRHIALALVRVQAAAAAQHPDVSDPIEAARLAIIAGDPAHALVELADQPGPVAGQLRGEAMLMLADLEGARKQFEALIAEDPENRDAQGGLAEALVREGAKAPADQAMAAWLGDRTVAPETFLVLRQEAQLTRLTSEPEEE